MSLRVDSTVATRRRRVSGSGASASATTSSIGAVTVGHTRGSVDGNSACGSSSASAAGPSDCSVENLPLHEAGMLTVATGEPVFEPWMVDDDPSNGQGFESALVYALAEELGFAPEDVTWVRTTFDGAIAPGDKDYDFNIQQFSISEERDAVVDFSDGYYQVEQALVAAADSDVASAGSLADLKGYKLGAAIATTTEIATSRSAEPSCPGTCRKA